MINKTHLCERGGFLNLKYNVVDYRNKAHKLIGEGISVIPLKDDGSKLPKILWKVYQDRLMTKAEAESHFLDCGGIAAITGKVSRLLCLDFDLDKALPEQDFWYNYMKEIPNKLKLKLRVNTTRSGGYHVFFRTDYEDMSRKLTRRYLTVPEIMERYLEGLSSGADPNKMSMALLKKPLECVIETRNRGSYFVIEHPDYKHFYGDTIQELSLDETEFMINRCYELDCEYKARSKAYQGEIKSFATIRKFNEDATQEDVLAMLESSGVYQQYKVDYEGHIQMKRVGSKNPYSAKIFETGNFYTYSTDTLFSGDRSCYTPFEVYCAVNSLDEDAAIEKIDKTK